MSDPFVPHIGDKVRHKNGGAPWLVLEVAFDPARREMVIARREAGEVIEGVRLIDEYEIVELAR